MSQDKVYREYDRIMAVLASGSREALDALAEDEDGFPDGEDGFVGRRWIINAIDCGSRLAVEWMISRGVDLDFRDDEGVTVLHAAIDREGADKYEILRALLAAGAPVNTKGFNDWTPTHLAAAREDIDALKLLVAYDADLTIRTAIDDYATPLEEARMLGRAESVRYLEGCSRPQE